MQAVRSFDELHEAYPGQLSVTVGNFDGFHRGHAAVVAELVAVARRRGTAAVAVTFEPHPLCVVSAPASPFVLTPAEEKAALMSGTGLDVLVVHAFDGAVAAMPARSFLDALGGGRLAHLVLGYDFRMGRGRACGVDDLAVIAAETGCALDVVPPVVHDGAPISSSRIREALWAADPEAAAAMLGRPYRLEGRVVTGSGLGSRIGFPTANLALPEGKLLPADGVYRAAVPEAGDSAGLLYVGSRPTLGGAERRAEVHVPGWDGTAPGSALAVDVVRYLRPDRAFATVDELREQIGRDVGSVVGVRPRGGRGGR